MRVCYFGAHDLNSFQNKAFIQRIKDSGNEIVFVNKYIPLDDFNKKEHTNFAPLVFRILRKASFIFVSLIEIKKIISSDLIFVGYPGHLEMPLAWLYGFIFDKPIVFYPVLILNKTFSDDVGLINKTSIKLKIVFTIEKYVCKLADVLIADTNYQKDYFVREFDIDPSKIAVLPIGADEKKYPYSGIPRTAKRFVVTYYGQYIPVHGVDIIIEAAQKCKNERRIEFWMVGKGLLYEETRRRVKREKLQNVVFFPDTTEENSKEVLSKSNVFLGFVVDTPAGNRTIPNKVYQGLSLGKAVVAADSISMRATFTNQKNIVFCEGNNSQSLADKILDLYFNPIKTKRIAIAGHRLFKEKFSNRTIGIELNHVFELAHTLKNRAHFFPQIRLFGH